MHATGASRFATGVITANTDSALTFAEPSSMIIVTNLSGQTCYVRLNGAVSPTVFDAVLADKGTLVIHGEIKVQTVHVYVNAVADIYAAGW